MQHEPGDVYIRRTAAFIRSNELSLAYSGLARRPKANTTPSVFNPLGWVGLADSAPSPPPRNPVVFSIDTHRLFYLLMRLEALAIDIGSLDVQVDNPSRPMSYISLPGNDKAETLSIASFRSSLSVISKLSLGNSWWGRAEPPNTDAELKYIYSSFTKLPALSIRAPGPKGVSELMQDPPANNAIPLDSFKNLSNFQCLDIDPRTLLGWDRLAESLRSLTIKRSGVDDPTVIFIDAVLEDQSRREGTLTKPRTLRLGGRSSRSFYGTTLPETVREESEERPPTSDEPQRTLALSPMKWAFLKHLCLADNALTSLPTAALPYLTSLTHLDLSSNLLVSIPSGLSTLYNLIHLNLSDNMIDSVLGIYKKLGQVISLNLSANRIDSLCGLERLLALERIDLRDNALDESAEVGRLAVLPNVAELWVAGNPLTEREVDWRVRCFDTFAQEGKTVSLDGALPTYYERRAMSPTKEELPPARGPAAYSPPTLAFGGPSQKASPAGTASVNSSPGLAPAEGQAKPRRKKIKRIVDLDGGESSDFRASEDGHSRATTDLLLGRSPPHRRAPSIEPSPERVVEPRTESPHAVTAAELPSSSPPLPPALTQRTRHSRYHTEHAPPSPAAEFGLMQAPTAPVELLMGETTRPSFGKRSSTMSSGSARRARVSASMYEAPGAAAPGFAGVNGLGVGAVGGGRGSQMQDADAFRARIEALRAEVGDGWLHVLSQSQFASPGAAGQVASRG